MGLVPEFNISKTVRSTARPWASPWALLWADCPHDVEAYAHKDDQVSAQAVAQAVKRSKCLWLQTVST